MATGDVAQESRMNRFRVGDRVRWDDTSEHPQVSYEGEVTGFGNEELTYLEITLDTKNGDSMSKSEEKTLTEDEVVRVA